MFDSQPFLAELMDKVPTLAPEKLDQMAALPLGAAHGTDALGRCGIGSCGVPRPSLGGYGTRTGATRGRPAAGGR